MWADNETSEDLLGFRVHADLLLDVIKDETVLPVTIGVFGDWGSGKSSILKMIHESLVHQKEDKLKDNTLVLHFNGWVFEGYDDAKAALLESILEGFEKHQKFLPDVGGRIGKLFKSVNWMRVLGLGFKKVVVPGAMAYATGGLSLIPFIASELGKVKPEELANKLSSGKLDDYLKDLVKDQEPDAPMMVRQFRKDFGDLIEASKIKKLVVVIDDLDRCSPERIIENFEAIKLFLNVEKTAFIIGADPRIVRHAIEIKYGSRETGNALDNDRIIDDYLEKVIQIPYSIPKLSTPEVETYISLLVAKRYVSESSFQTILVAFSSYRIQNRYGTFGIANMKGVVSDDELGAIKDALNNIPALASIIAQSLYGNPRQVKRFLNTLVLRVRLANIAQLPSFDFGLLAKLMILEYSELTLFTQMYNWQNAQEGTPEEIAKLEKLCDENKDGDIESAFREAKFSNWGKDKLYKWILAEPRLAGVDLRDYYWISREKVSGIIPGTSLIAPIVRMIFTELDNDSLPSAVINKILSEKVKILADQEIEQFLTYSKSKLRKMPKESRYYEIFAHAIEAGIKGAEANFVKVLEEIRKADIPASMGIRFKNLKTTELHRQFLNKYFEDEKTPAAKAYNLK